MYSSTLPSTSALDEGGRSTSRPGRFTPGERPGTRCIGGWVGPRTGLDGCGKSRPPPGFDPPDRRARSKSLYRLKNGPHKRRDTFMKHMKLEQYTYSVTLRRVRASVVPMKKATMHSVYVVALHITVNNTQITECCTIMLLWRIHVAGNDKMYLDLHGNVPDIFCPILTKFGVHPQIFKEVPHIKLPGNPSSGSRTDTCGQTEKRAGGQTRHDAVNSSFSRLTRKRLKITYH